jgi:hypothetical protein
MTAGVVVRRVLTSRYFGVGTASVIAAVGSSLLTKKYLEQKINEKYAALLDEQVHEAKAFYRDKAFKEGDFADPTILAKKYEDEEDEPDLTPEEFDRQSSMVKEAATILADQSYTPYNRPDDIPVAEPDVPEVIEVTASIQKNIFDGRSPIADGEDFAEINEALVDRQKDEGKPYVITHDEFFDNEDEWSENALSYFAQDEVLADEQDVAILDDAVDRIIGLENLQYFGAGSKDANIVYIANPNLEALYEVSRSTGSYSMEVMGIPINAGRTKARGKVA